MKFSPKMEACPREKGRLPQPVTQIPSRDPRRFQGGKIQFMQEKTTLDSLRRKLATFAGSSGLAFIPYDVDRLLSLGPYYFYDPVLDGPPRVSEVERLVRLGIPQWPLTNQGTVNETFALLETRRRRGLASIPQARLLRDRGRPRPWAVKFTEVGFELYHLRSKELT
jgi:hypothetical protein